MAGGTAVVEHGVRLRPSTHAVHPAAVTWWRLQDACFWAVLLVAGAVPLLFGQPTWLVVLERAVLVVARDAVPGLLEPFLEEVQA